MPTYEYECGQCGDRFEKFQKMSDKPVAKCPKCAGRVRRLIGTGAAVIFKGATAGQPAVRQTQTFCGRERPCCGRETPCDTRPCSDD